MRRAFLGTVSVIWFAALFPAAATAREPYADFYTPGKAVLCSAVVDITGENSNYVPWLFCWTPNDGFTVSLRASRRPGGHLEALQVALRIWRSRAQVRAGVVVEP